MVDTLELVIMGGDNFPEWRRRRVPSAIANDFSRINVAVERVFSICRAISKLQAVLDLIRAFQIFLRWELELRDWSLSH